MALQRSNTAKPQVEETAPVAEHSADAPQQDAVLETPEEAGPAPDRNEVAPRQTTAVAPSSPRGNVVNALADAGFAGLHIDWTSFPTIVLDKSEFALGDGTALSDVKSFVVRLQQSRKRYVYRTKTASDDDEAELAYSYDPSELDNPESEVAKKLEAWKADGLDWVVKEYIEVVAIVDDPEMGSLDQQMVLLQIPPTSTGRFSGYLTANAMAKGLQPSQYLTRVSRGDKVQKAKNPFYPWAFSFAGE